VNYHLNLASILAQQGKLEEAEHEIRTALERGPNADAYRILSELLEKRGDREGAIGAIRQALAASAAADHERGPGDAGRLRLVGLLLDADRIAEAEQVVTGAFDAAEIQLTAKGLLLEKEGRREEAAELYRRALATRPALTAALERLYRLLPAGAIPSLEPIVRRGLEENDGLAAYHNVLGVILKRGGDLDGAIAQYRRALALDPDQVDYLANLGAALMIRNDLPGALGFWSAPAGRTRKRRRLAEPRLRARQGRTGEGVAGRARKARELGATGRGSRSAPRSRICSSGRRRRRDRCSRRRGSAIRRTRRSAL
jgi:tetratricopeptide (TPR) repeat protein